MKFGPLELSLKDASKMIYNVGEVSLGKQMVKCMRVNGFKIIDMVRVSMCGLTATSIMENGNKAK